MRIMIATVALNLLIPFASVGQPLQGWPVDANTGKVSFTEVVQQEGSKAELFVKAIDWAAEEYKSAKDVIQVSDKNAGLLVLKGIFNIVVESSHDGHTIPAEVSVYHRMKMEFRDGRYRYELTDLQYEPRQGLYPLDPFDAEMYLLDKMSFEDELKKGEEITGYKVPKRRLESLRTNSLQIREQYKTKTRAVIESTINSLKSRMSIKEEDDDW